MPAFIPPLLGLIGLLIALGIFRVVLSYPEGNPEVKKIGDMIHSGAMSFMKTEYMYLVVFVFVLAVLVFFALGWETATAVLVGASSSALAGFIGMYAALKLILEQQQQPKIVEQLQLYLFLFMVDQ